MIKVSRGCVGEEELAEVRDAFEYGYFGLAAKVIAFEEAIGKYLGGGTVVATNTGTSALHLALAALGVGPGDEVIVPSLTYVANFQAITMLGGTPVPCDVDPETLLVDITDIRRRLTRKTKVIMPVHYAGNLCDIDKLIELSHACDVRIVEDAAHAFGSTHRGRKVGSFGDLTCFSFDSIKTITCGEGGAVICRDEPTAEFLRQMRLLGIDRKSHALASWKERKSSFDVRTQGYRYHMSNINAAIGLAQLRKADDFISRRRELCRRYDRGFRSATGIRILPADYEKVAPHIYVIRVLDGRRDALSEFLKTQDIETGINYIPNHLHSFFRSTAVHLPNTEQAYREILTLPLHCGLSDSDVDNVIENVWEFLSREGEVTR